MSIVGKKIGLALSGGGYRAAAYHIGTLRALHPGQPHQILSSFLR